jgi:molybdopterin-containing oxidoreductase family iron-sulfur binding subunit
MIVRGVVDSKIENSGYIEKLSFSKTGKKISLAILAGHPSQEGRGIIPMGPHKEEPHHKRADNGLYPEHKHHPYRWAMSIDLESCTGCGACVAACYVENNVSIVGEADHVMGREMSWLRIEPFYEKTGPEFIPMLCQHCDNAPCEPVCPVFAAYHNPDGLNAQIYNRCVGTRYCSNNCPYKVRRFNYWDNTTNDRQPLGWMSNPELSVRPRGVMEKCTFCVQRIRVGKDHAKDEKRLVRDGEITPACAQTCPTNAIVFGNILDENSRVFKLSQHERAYKVFEELGTRPAVTYLHPEHA